MSDSNELLKHIYSSLNSDVNEYEARVIFEHIIGESYLNSLNSKIDLNEKQKDKLKQIIEMRNLGKPLAYVLKSITFRNLDLYVDERVLIPRPETELLVERGLDIINKLKEPKVFEIGLGSGAISLSLVYENKNAYVYASDISPEAIEVAKLNMAAVGSASVRVEIYEGNLFDPFPTNMQNKIDLVISNPPYIGFDETDCLEESVIKNEPHVALFSGEKGDALIAEIIAQSKDWLKASGSLLMEISPRHEKIIKELGGNYQYSNIEFYKDFTGRIRFAELTN